MNDYENNTIEELKYMRDGLIEEYGYWKVISKINYKILVNTLCRKMCFKNKV